MKILWYANTPCGAATYLSDIKFTGGWLTALESELKKNSDIDLHVSFYHPMKLDSFQYDSVTYHPLFLPRLNFLSRIFNHLDKGRNLSRRLLCSVKKVADSVSPDVIHIHGTEENFGLIQEDTRLNCILSIQGLLLPYVNKFYSGIPSDSVAKNINLHDRIRGVTGYRSMQRNSIREARILSLSKNIMGRTDWDRRISRVYSPFRQYFQGDEILRPAFYNYHWKMPCNEMYTITTTMSNGLYKGYETLLKAASLLKRANFNFKWIVIGQSSNSLLVNLSEQFCGIDSMSVNIELVGHQSPCSIVKYFERSDCYCQVSHIENSPNSLCEAMLVGMPCIASFAGGTSSLLTDKLDGMLVQDGDPYSLSGAIMELAMDKNYAQNLGLAARARAQNRHNPSRVAEQIANVYTELSKRGH